MSATVIVQFWTVQARLRGGIDSWESWSLPMFDRDEALAALADWNADEAWRRSEFRLVRVEHVVEVGVPA